MRIKESEDDYRYFPDPDLPPLVLDAAFLERQKGFVPELPTARRARWVASLGLSEYDAGVLGASRTMADFFEAVCRAGAPPKDAANWVANDVAALLGDAQLGRGTLDELELRPHALAELVELVAAGRLSHAAGRKVLRAMVESGKRAKDLAAELGLEQVRDAGAIEGFCREALAAKPQIAEQVRAGNEKALGALIGPALAASQGRADPQLVRETLLRLIAEG
jgi:aspartyl-tRNA(Asn)/glutamyl-tRNA(Gln) amidotransferase subunit B